MQCRCYTVSMDNKTQTLAERLVEHAASFRPLIAELEELDPGELTEMDIRDLGGFRSRQADTEACLAWIREQDAEWHAENDSELRWPQIHRFVAKWKVGKIA